MQKLLYFNCLLNNDFYKNLFIGTKKNTKQNKTLK